MPKKSRDLRQLLDRAEKSWAVIDYYLSIRKRSKKKKIADVEKRLEMQAAEFVLRRLYPEKIDFGADGERAIPIILIRPQGNGRTFDQSQSDDANDSRDPQSPRLSSRALPRESV